MKLLFDQNLSNRLVSRLAAEFPASKHVRDFSMQQAEDWEIWALAASQDLTIVSKDTDFYERAMIAGPPPKVIWLRVGIASTTDIEHFIRLKKDVIETFELDTTSAVLILG